MGSFSKVCFLAAVLSSTASAAVAQYGTPLQRDYRGQPCPVSRVGPCSSVSVERDTSGSGDWRKQRERQLEDRSRTEADRDRDRGNWRVQRQRETDERFGTTDKLKSGTQENGQQATDR